jgi:CRP/FNR family transcriptional regulator, cyclic AMP receptor protein
MTTQASIVGSHQFLHKLPAQHVEQLAGMATHVTFPAHHRLFEEGTRAHSFWLIDAGQVALDAMVPGDGVVTIELLGRGDVLGLSWLQPPYQWKYGAITTQPMQAYEFDAEAVRKACAEDTALGYELLLRFAEVAAHRLQATRARLLEARAKAA